MNNNEPQAHKKRIPFFCIRVFYRRVIISFAIAFTLLMLSLWVGMWGYRHFEHMSWIDAFANAAMILSGMGPLSPIQTTGGKLFAGFYALYSGAAFLIAIAVMLTPILHHFVHKFHLDSLGDKNK